MSTAPPPRVNIDRERQIIEISPAESSMHSASCIFMHGLGDTANGFAGVCHSLAIEMPHIRFVCPTAPTSPVTMNRGMHMPSWYDIVGLENRAAEACDGIGESAQIVTGLLEREVRVVGHHRCILAGFSQGGAMALYVGLQVSQRLAGILAMSAYLPTPASVRVTAEALETPVLQCHGEADAMVKMSAARATEEFLVSHGVHKRIFHSYADLAHSVSDEEIQDVRDWLADVLP